MRGHVWIIAIAHCKRKPGYEISVLSSKKAQDLNAWLAENGFAFLPAKAAPIVSDYNQPGLIGSQAGNRVTGDGLRIEDSPGNFTIEKEATNIILRCYDNTGRPLRLDFPIGKAGGDAQ